MKGDAPSVAVYSDCERYRYLLTRVWDETRPRALFVMLNPSTATEVQNDPTVERCERRARADPVGPGNDAAIRESLEWAAGAGDRIICAWGAHGKHLERGAAVERLLRQSGRQLHNLGLTKAGAPKHPLYIGYDRQPELWPR